MESQWAWVSRLTRIAHNWGFIWDSVFGNAAL